MREIVRLGHRGLRQRATEVKALTAEMKALIDDMFEAMERENGLGLAAPQVGESVRLFVYKVGESRGAVFNPEILEAKGSEVEVEGCLSIPGIQGDVERAAEVVVAGRDQNWKRVRIRAEGLLARCLQHEVDHLNGILFIDRAIEGTLREVTAESELEPAARA